MISTVWAWMARLLSGGAAPAPTAFPLTPVDLRVPLSWGLVLLVFLQLLTFCCGSLVSSRTLRGLNLVSILVCGFLMMVMWMPDVHGNGGLLLLGGLIAMIRLMGRMETE